IDQRIPAAKVKDVSTFENFPLRSNHRSNPSAKRTESPQDVPRLIGLVDELSVRGHLRIARPALPAGDDDVDGRPSIANRSGKSQSIEPGISISVKTASISL